MGGPDIQRDLDPRGLLAPHNDLTELLALLSFQLRYFEMSGTSGLGYEAMILPAYVSGSRAAGLTSTLRSARDEQFPPACDHPPWF